MNGKYLFVVGGESKEFDQIAGIETGYGACITLWMIGLLIRGGLFQNAGVDKRFQNQLYKHK